MGYGYGWGLHDDFIGYGFSRDYPSWHRLLRREIGDAVRVVLTSGGAFSSVTGILARVYPSHIVLVRGNVVTEIPMNRIAAVSKLAGGGPFVPGGF